MIEPDPVAPSPPPESVTRNAGFSLATQLVTSAFTAGLTLFLARRLGADQYGLFALAVSVSALILLPVDFGISSSAVRFVATNRGHIAALRAVLADALGLKLLLTLPVCTLLAVTAGPIASAYGKPGLAWPLRGVAIAVVGQSLMLLYQGSFAALGRIRSQLRVQLGESSVETGASVVLVLLGGGASGAALGRGIGYLVGGVFALTVMARLLGGGVLPRRLRGTGRMRAIAVYATPLLIVNGAFTLFEQVDILIIGAVGSAAQVGLFQAPLRLTTFLQYPGAAIAYAVAPRLVGDAATPATSRARAQVALRVLILLDAAVVPPLMVWAEPIVSLVLGPGYGGSVPVLRVLAPFVFLSGLAPLLSLSLNYIGRARERVPIALVTLAINGALDAVLIPQIGIVGAAVGTTAALALYVTAHVRIYRRYLGIELQPLALTFLRAVAAAAATSGVLALVGTGHLSALQWVSGSVGGLAAFVGVLALTREVKKDELDTLTAGIRQRWSKAS